MPKNRSQRGRRRDAGTWFAILLFPLIFGGGGLALMIAGGGRFLDAVASRNWPQVTGTIVYVGQRSQSVDVRVFYDYSVNGRPYRSYQHSFSSSYASTSSSWSSESPYRVGQTVKVFYDAANPASSVLRPGIGTSFTLPLFGAIALAVGLAIGRFIYRASA